MGLILLYLLCGLGATIFSILAWRLKNDVYWNIGAVLTGVVLLFTVLNIQYATFLFLSQNIFEILLFASLFVLPGIFLYKAKADKPTEGFDGSTASGAVTEEYLDEVINAPDEDIDFEDGLDLR